MNRPMSVIEGRDPQVLQVLLDFYARPQGHVVDVTANRRRMWQGVVWGGTVSYLDNDPTVRPDMVADFRDLPVGDGAVDVLIFDPPHLPAAAGTEAGYHAMRECYGLAQAPKADNVAAYFPPFLSEAVRVLKSDGLIFAKLKDYVHNHKYQWMLVEWINAVRAVPGLTPCDLIIKRDPAGGNMKSSLWKSAHHARNAHCWWSVVRKGKCEPKEAR